MGFTEAGGNLIVHRPANQWEPKGYKDRNMTIGLECTGMLCIRCHQSLTHGSGWTATYAARLGRLVRRAGAVNTARSSSSAKPPAVPVPLKPQ